MSNVTLGAEINLPSQSITSSDPYDLDSSSYGDISVESLRAMGEQSPEETETALPSLLKPLLIGGAALLAFFSLKG